MKQILSTPRNNEWNALTKAPLDINTILQFDVIDLSSRFDNNTSYISKIFKTIAYRKKINKISLQEYLLIQFPYALNMPAIKKLKKYKMCYLIHDVYGIRWKDKGIEKKEIKIFSYARAIISHNQVMTDYLISQGIDSKKIVNLELFDYLCNEVEYKTKDISKGLTIAYAGNIDKALFVKQLDQTKMNFEMNLYGVKSDNLQINDKLHYIGKETPERLPNLIDAHLGLVWDGNIDSSDESDILKNYTRYNNPHKVSCYLAAGIPVIVWSKSAIWNFVRDNNCGYAIDNIYDINNLDLSDYEEKRKNAIEISKKVRSGYYTKKAFNTVFEKLGLEDRIK